MSTLVCVRVCDMAMPPVTSHRGVYCALCGTEVWVSMRAPLIDTFWCAQCAVEEIDDGDELATAPEIEDEVSDYWRRRSQ